MAFDFRATQLQMSKLIASGSTGTGALVLVYPISAQDQSNPNQGLIDNNKFGFSGIGSDIFMFVSGAVGSKNTTDSHGVTVFGGDVVISGNLTVVGTGGGGSGGGGGDPGASYLVISTTASLTNERALSAGPGIGFQDNGAGSTFIISASVIGSGSTNITSSGNHIVVDADNFSFKTITSGTNIKIKNNQQMLFSNLLTVDGTLEIDGDLIQIEDKKSASSLILADGNEVVISGSGEPSVDDVLTIVNTSPRQAIWKPISAVAIPDFVFSLTSSTGFTTSSIVVGQNYTIDNIGTDNLKFHVSGNASFGNNVKITGTLYLGSNDTTIFKDGNDLKFFDSNNPSGFTLTQLGAAGGGGGSGASITRQNVAGYYTATVTSSNKQVIGGLYFNPAEHNSSSIRMNTVLSIITGSDEAQVYLYNITSGSFVHVGGPGITYLSCSSQTPVILTSAQLLTAQNFNPLTASIYELRLCSASGSRAIQHNSEIVCT